MTDRSAENPRFVEVLVANSSRFNTLRALTVEGATAELERQAQERKDRGNTDSSSTRSVSRGASFDSARSPVSTRSLSLGMVPEDDRFAIGDEDDEDIGDTARPTSLSEKARGKQPEATVRPAGVSRNASASSLQSLVMPQRDGFGSDFQPSQAWLDSWYSRLPLEPIFKTIEEFESRKLQRKNFDRGLETTRTSVDGERDSKRSASEEDNAAGKFYSPSLKSHGQTDPIYTDIPSAKSTPIHFQWTPVAIGWYTALLWSRIYLQEAEAFQGSGGLYSSTNVVLFRRSAGNQEISLRSPKGAIDAVGQSLAQRISSFSLKGADGDAKGSS